jgi:hypothetical protein
MGETWEKNLQYGDFKNSHRKILLPPDCPALGN